MAESVTHSALREITGAVFGRLMKSQGFKRRRFRFFRASERLTHVIDFQSSRWNTASEGAFTINVGVWYPAFLAAWTGRIDEGAVDAYPVIQRIGPLIDAGGCELWWTAKSDMDLPGVTVQIVDVLTRFALPYLARFQDRAHLLSELRANPERSDVRPNAAVVRAVLAMELGFESEAAEQINAALRATRIASFSNAVMDVAARIGVPVEP